MVPDWERLSLQPPKSRKALFSMSDNSALVRHPPTTQLPISGGYPAWEDYV